MFRPQIILPHKDFLINNLSVNQAKNKLIEKLLIKITEYKPQLSGWWIFALCNHMNNNMIKNKKGGDKYFSDEDMIIQ